MPRQMLPPEAIRFFQEHRGFYKIPLDPAEDGLGAATAWRAPVDPAPASDAEDTLEP